MARSGNIYDPKFIIALISISDISPWRLLTKLQNLSWRHISVWKLKLTLPACLTTAHCFESTLHSLTGNCPIHLLTLFLKVYRVGLIQWNLNSFEFKFDDTRLSSWWYHQMWIQTYLGFIVLILMNTSSLLRSFMRDIRFETEFRIFRNHGSPLMSSQVDESQ